ncbi:hypothetical protein [Streptomyces sp. CAU 1734]|uniref:hypothetical protein n=1 Tax=Streptomyces sp. CAU 1734 TaxID=3140360 RepID=UPI00325FFFE8
MTDPSTVPVPEPDADTGPSSGTAVDTVLAGVHQALETAVLNRLDTGTPNFG